MATTYANIDDYIDACPAEVQPILNQMRSTILEVIPDATEGIRYSMPTFLIDEQSVVHFAAWKKHVSIYPAPSGDAAYEQAIAPYRSGEATAKFPLNQPIPFPLIAQIVTLLVDQAD
jgi:uncharacterized protein YdhG (YjbR/CyaY superfamily)